MAYDNFKPIILAANILQEKQKLTTFATECNTSYKGEAKLGRTVQINDIGRPTIGKYVPGTPIADPEVVAGNNVLLKIDQADYFNYMLDDVDEAQAQGDIMRALAIGSARALAEMEDSYIAKMCATEGTIKVAGGAISTAKAMKTAIDNAFETLWGNSVTHKDDVTMFLPPWAYTLFKDQLVELKTDNDGLIAKGVLGTYNNAKIKLSNNLYNDGTNDNIIIKTKESFAYVSGLDKVEPYRPEKHFADAVRGIHTYGGKLVRPKELVVLTAHKGNA